MKYYLNNSYEYLQANKDCSDCITCPQKLYIDITQNCNLWCKMCRNEKITSGKTMSIEMFKLLVDETSPYVRSYSLFNWGEPLLVKDFCERVVYVNQKKRSDCNIEISTNGILLNKTMIDFLATQKVNVIISVDSAEKNTFESIRRGANFDIIIENAKNAAKSYENYPIWESPQFYISIQKDNQGKLLDIAKLAFSIGIMRVGCGLVMLPKEYSPDQNEKLCRELEKMYQFIEDNGMFLDVHPTKVGDFVLCDKKYIHMSDFIVNKTCNAANVSASVDYSGNVYLCCHGGAIAGNICSRSFLEIWKSDQYNKLRQDVNDSEKMPYNCKNCAWFNRN